MRQTKNYHSTMIACYFGYITQAIVVNFAPLLFLTFQKTYGLQLRQITMLTVVNFLIQLLVDFLSSRYVDKLGYRRCIVTAHLFSAVGLVGLAAFPDIFPTPMLGLMAAVVIYGMGSGIIEVLISPIAEACPTSNKAAAMSLLHSFYSWGSVFTIAGSTALFALLGIHRWQIVSCLWAIVPLCNLFVFLRAPIARIVEVERTMSARELLKQRVFWVVILIMVSSGAAELAIAQWASAFAEGGLGIGKTVGDLAGPCLFAVLMGAARTVHGKLADRIPLQVCMTVSAGLTIVSYGLMVLAGNPIINLLGCALCGFSVGILWPGALSIASACCPRGGTTMFALLALSGDIGCTTGPAVLGFVSGMFGENLKAGIAAAAIFPVLVLVGISILKRMGDLTAK